MDTIFAVSSGRPPAAIAVLRVSGPAAIAAATTLAGSLPQPRTAGLRALRDADGALLDQALALVFPGPHTATGEDLVELHCHGGRAVVAAVERRLGELPGLRPAEPGEFTRRALLNGRIDLAQAEGLADLLSAETERQRRAAIDAADGRVSALLRTWMDAIADLSARCEALLDFAEEDDVAIGSSGLEELNTAAADLGEAIGHVVDQPSVERLHDGLRVVLAGPPNAGKSSLFNALAEREMAIVTPIAGTTRDRIEVAVQRDGIAYVLVDTAGLTVTNDVVEAIGVERSEAAMATADIVLWLGDDHPPVLAIWVHARADQPGRTEPAASQQSVSVYDAASVTALWERIAATAETCLPAIDHIALHDHQRRHCREAADQLKLASTAGDLLVIAEHCRVSAVKLGELLGVDALDKSLDALFARFCLGK